MEYIGGGGLQKVRGPGEFHFLSEMDDLLWGHHDSLLCCGNSHGPGHAQAKCVSGPRTHLPTTSTSAPSPVSTSAPSPAPAGTTSPPPMGLIPQAPPCPRDAKEAKQDLLTFLRESKAASQTAAQRRQSETLTQTRESQEGLQSLLDQMVEKMWNVKLFFFLFHLKF